MQDSPSIETAFGTPETGLPCSYELDGAKQGKGSNDLH
jgi:hypothetical protein